jgi:hypothetical protein
MRAISSGVSSGGRGNIRASMSPLASI